MDNDQSRDCMRYVRQLDDQTLIRATKRGSKTAETIAAKLNEAFGGWTNPEWIVGTAAEEAYYRDLISAEEMDRICN
jgi:Holliday junction resolvasome RuvABC DNA-binding subunit